MILSSSYQELRAVLFFLYLVETSQAHLKAVEQKCEEVIAIENKN